MLSRYHMYLISYQESLKSFLHLRFRIDVWVLPPWRVIPTPTLLGYDDLFCPDLDFPIRLPFMQMNQLTSELLLAEIERVLQSNEQFVLDHCVQLNITHVSLPKGGTIVFVCKSYYFECLIKELDINSNTSSNTTYKPTSFDKDEILANHRSFMTIF
jgi:hypothetical protein